MGPNGPVRMVRYDYALTPSALKVPLAMKLCGWLRCSTLSELHPRVGRSDGGLSPTLRYQPSPQTFMTGWGIFKAPTGLSEEGHLPGRGNARRCEATLRIDRDRTLEVTAPRGSLHADPVDAIWPQVVGRVNTLFDRDVHRVPNHLDDLLAVAFHCGPHERTRRHARRAILKCR